MPRKTTVTVVGSITKDIVWRPNESIRTGLGGLLYNTIALAALMPDATIMPVANVGKDILGEVTELLSRHPNIHLDGIRRVDRQNACCYLLFVTGTHFNDGSIVPITRADVEGFLSPDIILITFPTGLEMTLGTLKFIRRKAKCPIYIDYHMLDHGRDQASARFGQKHQGWVDWVQAADFAQFNQFEAEHLFGRPMEAPKDILSFGRRLLRKGMKAAMITFGEKGSFVVQSEDGKLGCAHIPSERGRMIVDTLGCGDVYSAGFIAQYLRSSDAIAAAHFASEAAAQRCRVRSFDELFKVLRGLV